MNSDLGVHVDGYVALVAKTVVVGGAKPVTGRAADAIMACKTASEVILRMLQPGQA
jgi:methionine aminopeptidase